MQCNAMRCDGTGTGAGGEDVRACSHRGKCSDERLAWAPSVSRRRRKTVVAWLHVERSIPHHDVDGDGWMDEETRWISERSVAGRVEVLCSPLLAERCAGPPRAPIPLTTGL